MGSKQSTTSGPSASGDTPSSTTYSRDYLAADAAESSSEERARTRSLAALFASPNDRSHQAVLHHHNRQSAIESIFSPFGVRPSASSHSHNDRDSSIADLDAAQFAHSLPGYLLFPQSKFCPFFCDFFSDFFYY